MAAIKLRRQGLGGEGTLWDTVEKVESAHLEVPEEASALGVCHVGPRRDGSRARRGPDVGISVSSDAHHTRLPVFLQRGSHVCESLLTEHSRRARDLQRQRERQDVRGSGIFASSESQRIGSAPNGMNELIRSRRCSCLAFSQLQTSLFITGHPSVNDEDDLKPFKGLFSIWDASQPSCPLWVLEATGDQPTAACFSLTQSYLILGAMADGAVHLWDLREDNGVHRDKDAVDLGIEKGIRKPGYSSNR